MDLSPGDRIDRYTLVRPLGQGGQGSVWQVVDPLDEGALRALKIVRLADAGQAAFVRARREAKILAHLEHPSLCACHGFFEDLDKGLVGVVLDFVNGSPLDALIHGRDPRLGERHRFAILSQVAEALAYVHAAGLAHRDLKPSNVLVTDGFWEAPERPGTVKLVDFGIAVPIGNPHRLTSEGGVIGTVRYLSPELFDAGTRAAAEESCARDMFAFGLIAWEVLFEGHPTGLGHSASFEVMAQRYRELSAGARPWPPKSVSGPWGAAITACLALGPDDRPENGAALREILRTGKAPTRRAVVVSRTETHTPASAPPRATRSAMGAASTTAPMTAPMTAPTPPMPPPPPGPRGRAPSSSGPMYALAIAIVVLAAAIYLKWPGQGSQAEDAPLFAFPSSTSPTSVLTTNLPDNVSARVVATDGVCCGGPLCRPPKKNVSNSFCARKPDQCASCSSGRDFVGDPCSQPLDPDRALKLRLASVDVADLDTVVCFEHMDRKGEEKCVSKREASDVTKPRQGRAYVERLDITTKELLGKKVFVTIKTKQGDILAKGPIWQSGLLTTALCIGTYFHIGEEKIRVGFYLDDP